MAKKGSAVFAVGDGVLYREARGGRTGKVFSYREARPGRVEALIPNVSGFLWLRSEGAPILSIALDDGGHALAYSDSEEVERVPARA